MLRSKGIVAGIEGREAFEALPFGDRRPIKTVAYDDQTFASEVDGMQRQAVQGVIRFERMDAAAVVSEESQQSFVGELRDESVCECH